MPVNYKNSSPYSETPQFNFNIQYMGFYVHRDITEDPSDDIIRIGSDQEYRPDLLSYELYGTPDFWWIFSVRNPDLISDPIYDLVTGIEIYVPTKTRLFRALAG